MRKRSIGSWAYSIGPYAKNPVPFDQVVTKLKELGFDGVELGGFPAAPQPGRLPRPGLAPAGEGGMVADAGLEFSGLAANLWMHKIISVEDNRPFLNEFKTSALPATWVSRRFASTPSSRPTSSRPRRWTPRSGWTALVSVWDKCSKMAADVGMNVCWEFEPGFPSTSRPRSCIVDAVRAKGNPNFGVLYDTCHAHMAAGIGANQAGPKETLPGGDLELLESSRARSPTSTSSTPTAAERAQHQHA